MPISAHEIIVGRCYETANHVRRVLSIENGEVTYETSLPTEAGSSHSVASEGLDHFAQRVNREVPCGGRRSSAGWT